MAADRGVRQRSWKVVRHTVQAPNGTYQTYYGRGYVQLTWKSNYISMGYSLGMGNDLANNPSLALDPGTAYRIMSFGIPTAPSQA